MAEIDYRGQSSSVMTMDPGDEYLVLSSVSTGKSIAWEFVGDGPFDVKVKGITLTWGFIPNPFNSDWLPASENYGGVAGWFGMKRDDSHVTLHLVVRTSKAGLRIRFEGNWKSGGGISFPFNP